MRIKKILSAILVLVLCMGNFAAYAAYDMPYYIEVDITNQIVTIYKTEDGSVVRQMLTSSGINDCTPNGTFHLIDKGRVTERTEWTYFEHYQCWVKYATRIYRGYMFHSLPFAKKDDSTMIQEMVDDFGLPTSHGCMRLRVEDAKFIAEECDVGTRVRIYKNENKEEDLRQLLYVSSYTGEGGMTYQEFLGFSEEALSRGATGTAVSDLQHRLVDLGYFPGEPNGRYDIDTIEAVKHVQQDLGLTQNGITTPELQEVLFSDDAPISAGQVPLAEGSSGPVVKKLQNALRVMGVYTGDIDSVYDAEVADAVRLFQGAFGYDVDGVASAELQQALYYHISKLEETFGADSLPAAEVVKEEITMARLNSKNNIIIRSQPNTDSKNLGKLTNGDTMLVNGVQGDWVNVTFNSVTGYVMKKYLQGFNQYNVVLKFSGADGETYTLGHTMAEYANGAQTPAEEFTAYYTSEQYSGGVVETVDYVTVNTGSNDVNLNLRAEASSGGAVLAEVPNGTDLRVLAAEEGWTKVGYADQIGYLMNDYLTFWQGGADEVDSAIVEEYSYADTLELDGEGETIRAVVVCAEEDGKVPVYESGSDTSECLGRMPAGEEVLVLQINSATGWALIEYEEKQGYMMDDNLQFHLLGTDTEA